MFRYFKIGDHYRRTCPDGTADLCEHEGCRLPRRFSIESKDEIEHDCRVELFADEIVEDEDDSDVYEDDDDMLDLGFAMRDMSTAIDYGGVIE